MKTSAKVALTLGSSALIAAAVLQGATAATASPAHTHTFTFTNQLDSRQVVQVNPGTPTVGDASYIASHVVKGAAGRTAATCTLVSLTGGGVRLCEVDFLLSHGTITTRGITNLASQDVTLVVTGGTGHYFGARGAGTLTSTPTGSVVQLRLG